MSNKIVTYYTPDDERLSQYYVEHKKLLGLDKQPFGIDQNGVLRFEEKDTNSKIWQEYKSLGKFEHGVGDYNQLHINFQRGKYSIEEFMQFYREDGASLCHLIDVFSDKFYAIEDKQEFEKALVELDGIEHIENATKNVLEDIFLAHLNSVEDELIFEYRKEAKKIINKNFGPEAWDEFIESIKNNRNER